MQDFRKCAARPVPILLGFLAQFGIMPFTGVWGDLLVHLRPPALPLQCASWRCAIQGPCPPASLPLNANAPPLHSSAYAIARLMGLHPSFATGLVLLGCCPGGQASNVATFVARGGEGRLLLRRSAAVARAAQSCGTAGPGLTVWPPPQTSLKRQCGANCVFASHSRRCCALCSDDDLLHNGGR